MWLIAAMLENQMNENDNNISKWHNKTIKTKAEIKKKNNKNKTKNKN